MHNISVSSADETGRPYKTALIRLNSWVYASVSGAIKKINQRGACLEASGE
ncbi:hypothetical protein [Endozoicomonas sp. 8E]|uniref:hypothetical protein n=1 Tax=Endozoicomonas sp. 8E TaxID=3035692 RepID=UPI0029390C2B|nr:hypothetical protein [Endozoicomonas sp. 8E]WOG29440.1 hypothetical protein P6910_07265 [Endozoicomonas sp. 8E]